MSYVLKKALVTALRPFAAFSERLEPLRRLWANARLNSALAGTVDPSVVVLNTPELQGTRKITLGTDLYLYRDLYLETQENGYIKIGNDVVLSRGVHLVAFAGIVLEDGVMIGEYSSIHEANHWVIQSSSARHSSHLGKPVTMRRNALIGRGM